jgi:hypothetical protein
MSFSEEEIEWEDSSDSADDNHLLVLNPSFRATPKKNSGENNDEKKRKRVEERDLQGVDEKKKLKLTKSENSERKTETNKGQNKEKKEATTSKEIVNKGQKNKEDKETAKEKKERPNVEFKKGSVISCKLITVDLTKGLFFSLLDDEGNLVVLSKGNKNEKPMPLAFASLCDISDDFEPNPATGVYLYSFSFFLMTLPSFPYLISVCWTGK